MNDHPSICICGSGTMGSGIAQVFAGHGFQTILYDVQQNMLDAAKARIARYEKNESTLESIRFTTNISDCKADLIIEAIVENEELKSTLINDLAALNSDNTIFVTNTSSLSVTSLASKLLNPRQFAGMHFFNPAPLMKLVEVITTPYTVMPVIDFIMRLAKQVGKTPVICKDSPGFIVNRVARPYYLEALYMLEKNISDIETTDALMEATGFKMGPFKLMDLIGNDVNYSVSCIVHEALGRPERLKPSSVQEMKVKEGSLGRKSGKGYYEYPNI